MMDSLIWAELGSMWPKTGGSYIYLRECYGPDTWGRYAAFLFIWQFIVSGPAEIAAGFIAIIEYMAFFTPNGVSYWTRVGCSLALSVSTVFMLYRKTSESGTIALA